MNSVVLVPYNKDWNVVFSREAELLKSVLAKERVICIEHFGSTSIPGMLAKPTIDIIMGLNTFFMGTHELQSLKDIGYIFIENSKYCQRFYFQKMGCFEQNKLGVNLSVAKFNGCTWHDCLNVRDYLLSHPLSVDQYIKVKLEAISMGLNSINDYSLYKQKFLRSLVTESRQWRTETSPPAP